MSITEIGYIGVKSLLNVTDNGTPEVQILSIDL